MFSHIINKYQVEASRVIAITIIITRNKIPFQIYSTDTGTFLIVSVPG
jgi:hypothetical protein